MFTSNPQERYTDSHAGARSQGTDFCLPGEIERALRSTGYQGLRSVVISVDCGVVFLGGHVSSFHMKQVAQTVARLVPGVCEIRNELTVIGSR